MTGARYRAYICCGPNCGPRGALSLLRYLEEEVERRGITELVSVAPTGCQSHCESGPTMVVYPGPVFYQEVTTDRLDRIIAEHFLGDRPVREYFWTGATGKKFKPLQEGSAPAGSSVLTADLEKDSTQRPTKALKRRPPQEVDDLKW